MTTIINWLQGHPVPKGGGFLFEANDMVVINKVVNCSDHRQRKQLKPVAWSMTVSEIRNRTWLQRYVHIQHPSCSYLSTCNIKSPAHQQQAWALLS